MFPLKKRHVILTCAGHVKAGRGCGEDDEAAWVPLYAPFAGRVSEGYPWKFRRGSGGLWVVLTRPNGDRIEFAHMSKIVRTGTVAEGTIIGITGNSGKPPWGGVYVPHLHIQILNKVGGRIDPGRYDWQETTKPLIDRVNEALRHLGSPVTEERSAYYQSRVAEGTITTYEKLIDTIKYRRGARLFPHLDGQ